MRKTAAASLKTAATFWLRGREFKPDLPRGWMPREVCRSAQSQRRADGVLATWPGIETGSTAGMVAKGGV